MSIPFPQTPEFSGALYTPSRVEAEVFDLEIEGILPASICGTFYQVAPDPQYPPMLGNNFFSTATEWSAASTLPMAKSRCDAAT